MINYYYPKIEFTEAADSIDMQGALAIGLFLGTLNKKRGKKEVRVYIMNCNDAILCAISSGIMASGENILFCYSESDITDIKIDIKLHYFENSYKTILELDSNLIDEKMFRKLKLSVTSNDNSYLKKVVGADLGRIIRNDISKDGF